MHDTAKSKDVLDYVDKEFSEWKRAGRDKAILPKVLDFNKADKLYFGDKVAYGESAAAGYADNDCISLSGMDYEHSVQYALRHETMHLNQKEGTVLPDDIAPKKPDGSLDFAHCKYRDEFLRAGISPEHVEYAYNNALEFTAVAAEGDVSKYSPEFKKVLIDLGMPEWSFEMKTFNPQIKQNIAEVNTRQKIYPDKSLEETYYCFVDKSFNFDPTVPLAADAKLLINGSYVLDLSSPEIAAKLNALQNNDLLRFGKGCDIDIPIDGRIYIEKNAKGQFIIRGGMSPALDNIEYAPKDVHKKFFEE